MITIRRSSDRGHFDHGWLDTYHTFSFGRYIDRAHMGFRLLRVINEDRVQPGMGFPMHGHSDMEIVTYVLEGALEHRDSMGNGAVLRPGEFQRMTAGTGIEHSEFNPSDREPVHLYQIWLLTDRPGHTPSYEQRAFDEAGRRGRLQLVAAPNGVGDALAIHQDARIYLSNLDGGEQVTHTLAEGRAGWVQVLRGTVSINGQALSAGDGAAISDEGSITLDSPKHGDSGGELMLFDMA